MQVRADVPEAYLLAQVNAFSSNRMNGMVSVTFYRSDGDPRELWMVAMFESQEAYRKNAESPAQHSVYLTLRACLERDIEWHDVDAIGSMGRAQPK